MDEKNKNPENNSPEKRSIRNIPLTKKQTKELEKIEEEMKDGGIPTPPLMPPPPSRPVLKRPSAKKIQKTTDEHEGSESRKRGSSVWWLVAVAVCLILIYGVAHYFARATVTIVRAEETVILNENEFNLSTSSDASFSVDTIQYKKTNFSLVASTTVAANGQQTIQRKATGKIVVYNDSNSAQLLIATTRFQTQEGLVFRLSKDVTVPAKKNVTVEVTAEQAGEKYNIGPKTFSLPALGNTAKAKSIYGKSPSSMTGGSVSTVPQTSSADVSAAKTVLQEELKKLAMQRALSELPEGYILLENSMVIIYAEVKQTYNSTTKTATLSQSAPVAVYYLEEESLSSAVASKSSLFSLSTSSIEASIDTMSLVAEISSENNPDSLTINGTSTVKAEFDASQISGEVSGMTRKGALARIKSLPGVDAVQISLQPWWEQKLPVAESVKVEIE